MSTNPLTAVRVAHLVHSTKVGGVEVAAAALQEAQEPGMTYSVGVLAGTKAPAATSWLTADAMTSPAAVAIGRPDCVGHGLNNPLSVVPMLRWLRSTRPDVLVVSLWRSVLVGVMAKTLWPRLPLVIFVHNTEYKNALDRVAHRIGLRFVDAVFCDAEATRRAVVADGVPPVPVLVVPLVARAGTEIAELQAQAPRERGAGLRLIYWGRVAGQKRLDRAVRLLSHLRRLTDRPLTMDIIGPDEGEAATLDALARELGVANCLSWHGATDWTGIRQLASGADFFVQLSDFEGLGMSVVEAMQLGIVPVVTPVGQIADFTRDGENALQISAFASTASDRTGGSASSDVARLEERELDALASRMLTVRSDPAEHRRLSENAAAEWTGHAGMAPVFADACRQVVSSAKARRLPGRLVSAAPTVAS